MSRLAIACAIALGACGSSKKPENPFGVVDDRLLALLHDECPVVRHQSTGEEAWKLIGKQEARGARRLGVRELEYIEVDCPADANGDRGNLEMQFDHETRQMIRLNFIISERLDAHEHPRVERMLAHFVDPWIRVESPEAIRELVNGPPSQTLDGETWQISGGTRRAPDEIQVMVDAFAVPAPEGK